MKRADKTALAAVAAAAAFAIGALLRENNKLKVYNKFAVLLSVMSVILATVALAWSILK